MRTWCRLVVVLVGLFATPVRADEVADSVQARKAIETEDAPTLETLIRDPERSWKLLENVAIDGGLDAAAALAKHAGPTDRERMLAYVETLRTLGPPAALRDALRATPGKGPAARLPHVEGLDASGMTVTACRVLDTRAQLLWEAGEAAKAAAPWREAAKKARAIGWETGASDLLNRAARTATRTGDWRGAVSDLRAAISILERRPDDRQRLATTLTNLGVIYGLQGRAPEAIAVLRRSLAMKEKRGADPLGIAYSHGNLGVFHLQIADYAQALLHFEKALARFRELGAERQVSATLSEIGGVWRALGDLQKAADYYHRAQVGLREHGSPEEVARVTLNLASLHMDQDEFGRAEAAMREGILGARAAGNEPLAVRSEGNLAAMFLRAGRPAEALSLLDEAIARAQAADLRTEMPNLHYNRGNALQRLDRLDEALRAYEAGRAESRRLRARHSEVRAITAQSSIYEAQGQYERALDGVRAALTLIETMVGGLGERGATIARSSFKDTFGLGCYCAAKLGRAGDVLLIMESARAGALLESLGGRDAMRWVELPEELRELRRQAASAQVRAYDAYSNAVSSGQRKTIRAASKAMDAANAKLEAVIDRIQREAKRQAGLLYPRATTMAQLQASLDPDEAFVAFEVFKDSLIRLVVTPERAVVPTILNWPDIEKHVTCFDCADVAENPLPHIAALRSRLREGLALGPQVKRVLVSPVGRLCYTPFQLVFDETVVMLPSGTTFGALRDDEGRSGTGVLGIGAPAYAGVSEDTRAVYFGGKPLAPLPGAAEELRAVADVRLLDKDATESGFREVVTSRERWRAVHFACHGLIDSKHPGRSALALSRSDTDDGFLTGLEVFQTRIAADTVVLSACETAKGKLVAAEGLVGLARAFMYAGAPRVICSLWKVDDAATAALMKRFYELWNPKDAKQTSRSASDALREAKAFVAAQEKWNHPYYWAAWQIWGLP